MNDIHVPQNGKEISLSYETEIYYIIIASWLNQSRIIDA